VILLNKLTYTEFFNTIKVISSNSISNLEMYYLII